MNNQPLILIDAYSQIFRAYYAIRHLSNSKGEPTNAIFVFARLLLKNPRFVSYQGQPLRMIPVLRPDPALLEQPLYH